MSGGFAVNAPSCVRAVDARGALELVCGRRIPHHPRSWWAARRLQSQICRDPRSRRARGHRRHLQLRLHAGARHRPAQPCLRDAEGEFGFPHGLLRQGHDLRHQGDGYEGTAELMSYYPTTVKDWLDRHGGIAPDMKKVKNGPELWAMVDPCPKEFF